MSGPLVFSMLSPAQCQAIREAAAGAKSTPTKAFTYCMRIAPIGISRWVVAAQRTLDRGAGHHGLKHPVPLIEAGPPALVPRVTIYTAPAFFDWHRDGARVSGSRPVVPALTAVAQLTDPREYEGGDLRVRHGGSESWISRALGDVAVFPSTWWHSVAPVTRGSRESLVFWGLKP